jgi:hypothetical protein
MWLIPASMRSAYAPALPCWTKESELHSAISALTSEQWPMVNGKPLQPASWLRSWKRERWMQRLCGAAIFDACQRSAFEEWWTSSYLASPAPTSPSREDARALMGLDPASSSMSSIPQIVAVRGASLWRTCQPSLRPPPPLWTKPKASSTNARPPESWENWPTAGGIRNGSLFPRPMWEPTTAARDGFASLGGWPTPDTGHERINRSPSPGAVDRPTIALAASQWRTPDAPGDGGPRNRHGSRGKGHQVTIAEQAEHWPTPQAHDAVGGKTPEQVQAMRERTGAGVSNLNESVQQWPTPAARDVKGANSAEHALVTGGAGSTWTN